MIQVIPVPGRAVRTTGANALFRIWIVVTTLLSGDSVLVAVGTTVVVIVIGSVVGSVVGMGVNSVVGTAVVIVVGRVVTGCGAACWVHPVKAIHAIRRIIKPKAFFMKSKLDSPLIKVTYRIMMFCPLAAQQNK